MLVVFPLATWISFAVFLKIFSKKQPFSFYFKIYVISFILLLVSAHLSKTLDKWNNWLKGVSLPFKDPFGVNTFQAIFIDKTIHEPGKIVPLSTLRWLPLSLLMIGTAASIIKIIQVNKYLHNSVANITPSAKSIPFLMALLIASILMFNVWLW